MGNSPREGDDSVRGGRPGRMGARFGAGFKAGKSMRRDARQTPLMSRHPGRGARQTPLMSRHPVPEVPVLKALRSSREKS